MKLQTKLRALIPIGILFLLSVAPLSAQNTLPSPQESSCWESLSTLRACALEQYNRELDQAERCTSYPEYQCTPAPEQSTSQTDIAKSASNAKSNRKTADATPISLSDSAAATATAQPLDAK